VLLIDPDTREIINAERCLVEETMPPMPQDSVQNPTAIKENAISPIVQRTGSQLLIAQFPNNRPIAVFDLMGRKLAGGFTHSTPTYLDIQDNTTWIVVIGNNTYRLAP
jgi:hypothetical protein